MTYDVAVIGGGVIGSMIARELSLRDIKLCLIEKGGDVCAGASRANSGIVHGGYDAKPGSLKARMNVAGAAMMAQTAKELGVMHENTGSLVVAFGEEEEQTLQALHERGNQNGVPARIVESSELREMEPMLSEDITAALFCPSAGIICPFTLAIASAENAAANGADVMLSSEVTAIEKRDGVFHITAGGKEAAAKYIVNAAGVHADEICEMAGGEAFSIRPRKGEYIVFDTDMEAYANHVIFPAPTEMGKGVLFAPTVYGNMLAGPTAQDIKDKGDKATSREGLNAVIEGARAYVPKIERSKAITVFAGLRSVPSTGDFIIEASKRIHGLVNVAGIESPGLTSAPAIAEYVAELLFGLGLPDAADPKATRIRRPIERFDYATPARQRELIENDARYASIVCRCENITEAEIVQSIERPNGARTVDGVKFRAGAGSGRCHGGFCTPRVMEILARELGEDYGDITKSGGGATILDGRTKGGTW